MVKGNGKSRRRIFKWPSKAPPAAEMARAGFVYTPTEDAPDQTTCFVCQAKIDCWDADDNPFLQHLELSPNCVWAVLTSPPGLQHAREQDLTSLAGTSHDPNLEYYVELRRSTFVNWPHENKRGWRPKADALARAGFHYAPGDRGDDNVECAYCGTCLNDWERNDDPEHEHFCRKPQCLVVASRRPPSRPTKLAEAASEGLEVIQDGESEVSLEASQQSLQLENVLSEKPDIEEDSASDAVQISGTVAGARESRNTYVSSNTVHIRNQGNGGASEQLISHSQREEDTFAEKSALTFPESTKQELSKAHRLKQAAFKSSANSNARNDQLIRPISHSGIPESSLRRSGTEAELSAPPAKRASSSEVRSPLRTLLNTFSTMSAFAGSIALRSPTHALQPTRDSAQKPDGCFPSPSNGVKETLSAEPASEASHMISIPAVPQPELPDEELLSKFPEKKWNDNPILLEPPTQQTSDKRPVSDTEDLKASLIQDVSMDSVGTTESENISCESLQPPSTDPIGLRSPVLPQKQKIELPGLSSFLCGFKGLNVNELRIKADLPARKWLDIVSSHLRKAMRENTERQIALIEEQRHRLIAAINQ